MKFIIISLSVFLLFHIVGYFGLIRHISNNKKTKNILLTIWILHFILLLIFLILHLSRVDFPSIIDIPLSLTLLLAMLFFTSGIINIILILIFKKHKIAISKALATLTIITTIYSIYNASLAPKLVREDIYLPKLKHEMSILMITDLHLSRLNTHRKIEQTIELANSSNPDIIVLVGDIIDSKENVVKEYLPHLEKLHAKYGVYFVLGNHEYIFDANKSLELMRALPNIKTLVNESVVINDNINLVGLSDLTGKRRDYLPPDESTALKGIREDLPIVLLSHQPNIIKELDSKVDLILSGHTHGGQVFPFSIGAYFANPFLYGLKRIDDMQLYISQGSHLAVTYGRFGTQSEINLLTLKKEIK